MKAGIVPLFLRVTKEPSIYLQFRELWRYAQRWYDPDAFRDPFELLNNPLAATQRTAKCKERPFDLQKPLTTRAEAVKERLEALQRRPIINEDERGEAVSNAAELGLFEVIDALLKGGPISPEMRGAAMVVACGDGNISTEGYLEVVELLLANDAQISVVSRALAAAWAVAIARPDIAELLLANGHGAGISEDWRVKAEWEAWREAPVPSKEVWSLAYEAGVSEDVRGWAASQSVMDIGVSDRLRAVLVNGAEISKKDREWAIATAATYGNLGAIKLLLEGQTPFSAGDLDRAARWWAVKNGNHVIADVLIKTGGVSVQEQTNLSIQMQMNNRKLNEPLLVGFFLAACLAGGAGLGYLLAPFFSPKYS